MRRKVLQSRASRALARVLVAAQVLSAIPVSAAADPAPAAKTTVDTLVAPATASPPPPQVTVNRTVPKVEPVPLYAAFSSAPVAQEITRARVFGEPLFPIGGDPTSAENQDLAAAIQSFQAAGDVENVTPFGSFLVEHPDTPWRASLLMNLGVLYRTRGFFTRATEVLQEAWALAKDKEDPGAEATAYGAMGELLDIRSQFGQLERLQALLADLGDRPLRGDLTGRVAIAQFTVGVLTDHHELACPSGPQALERIRIALGLAGPQAHPEIQAFPASHEGADLAQMDELSKRVGLRMRMAHRTPGAPLPLPAMVHLKQNHFSAVTKLVNGRYLLSDPFLGGEVWISQAALDEEASGYFLVLDGPLAAGWRSVDAPEARAVKGKCGPQTPPDTQTGPPNTQTGGSGGNPPCQGMATYTFHRVLANLHITDTPVGYSPPRGPAVQFQINNNHRESYQPQTFTYSNFGQKWVFDWMAYVQDDPGSPGGTVRLFTRGGGSMVYLGVTGTGSTPDTIGRSQLVLVSTSPVVYERRNTDGSVEVYAQPDGAMTVPRRVFMTQAKDPQGNALTFTYDAQMRLVSVTDAIGQVSTLGYEMSADPLKITRVTDPFGRIARFEYDATGKLWRITDVIGLQSSFEYGILNYIQSMTTPYGTTLFNIGLDNYTGQWWAQATDPVGGTERIHYGSTGTMPASEPVSAVPLGFTNNVALNAGASYYWDKRAWALYPGDFTKAHTMKWRVDSQTNRITDVLASEKKPLENRVWYEHVGGPTPNSVGSSGRPARIGRVLDDGTPQVYQYEYNSQTGKKTRATDPLGRTTTYTYAPNGIDLLEVRQVNGQTTDLLQSYTYNSQHRPLSFTDSAGQTTTYTYLPDGRPQTIVSPPRAGLSQAERTTTHSYYPDNAPTGAGKLQTTTGPSTPQGSPTTSYTYDGYGRVQTTTDSDGYTLTYDYDALDRMTKTTYPDGTYEETAYNRLDAERKRDRLGRWTDFFYDALRRVVAIRDPRSGTTTQQWCNCGSLDKVIDANGNATTWERDLQGRVTREVGANGSAKELTYETTTRRLKKVKDAKNQEIQLSYFLDDNLQQLSYVNAQVSTPNASFTYDPVYNRPVTMVDGTGTTTYTHNPIAIPPALGAGRLASVDGPLANDTVSYSYDELGRVVNRPVNGVSAASSYDALGRTATLGDALGSFSFSYEGTTRRLSAATYPNGQTASYAYYPNSGDHRLQDIHYKNPASTTLSRFTYLYDAVGDIKTWTQQADTNPAKAYDLSYDGTNELTEAIYRTTDPTPVVLKRYGYAYDVAGNRTTEQVDDVATSSSHDNMNRLTSQQAGGALVFKGTVSEVATVTVQGKPATVTPDNRFQGTAQAPSGTSNVAVVATDPSGNVRTNTYQVTQSGTGKTLSYDANGNLIGDGAKTYEWDAANSLVAVVSGTQRSEFTYDGKGHRVRIVEKDNSVVTSDRWFLWCDEDICEERDSGGSNVRKRFLSWGMQEDGVSYFYTRDHLRSIRELTDTAGTIRARYDYDPYGRVTKLTGDKDSAFRYTDHYFHAPSALTLAYYRAYDSGIGRWISPDPDGSADGPNLYAYVGDNPINTLDPQGLAGTCWTKIIKVTKVESCTAQIINPQGSGCGIGGVATLCAGLTKKAQGKKGANLDPPTCPAGETCTNLKPQTFVELFNETMNFTICGGWPVKLCCTFTAVITGKFIGSGEIGTCCSDPTGKKCEPK